MTVAISIHGLIKTFPGQVEALKGIDLEVAHGDFFALLGPNGAGKSTTIGIISSLVNKTSGQVKVYGIDIDKDFPRVKQLIGVVPQEFNFSQFEKVFNIVVTQAGLYGVPKPLAIQRTEKYLKLLGLWEKRNTVSRMLSGGMKRRLLIARALIHEPRLLILDEPTAGVDIELRRSMWDFLCDLNRKGTTIILTTHYLEEAENLCRNIAIIDSGEIIEHESMRSLLAKLDVETFLLDTQQVIPDGLTLQGFNCEKVEAQRLQVSIQRGQSLNELFTQLTAQQIAVTSLKNKANRLEELFVSLLNKRS